MKSASGVKVHVPSALADSDPESAARLTTDSVSPSTSFALPSYCAAVSTMLPESSAISDSKSGVLVGASFTGVTDSVAVPAARIVPSSTS